MGVVPLPSPAPGGSLALREATAGSPRLVRAVATPAAAFFAARRMYLEGRRLEMQAVAAELDISRATLYRWTGSREQLLSDVLWSLSNESFERAKAENPEHTGAERLLAIFRQHVGELVTAEPLQMFLRHETHAALRILTTSDGGVQPRTVSALTELYREEASHGTFRPHADLASLAYAVVRVTEGFIYNDAIAAVEPAVERAASIVSLLLR